MNDPFLPQQSTEIVFHYTDMNALISILGKDYISLRATNCLYLNDSNEIIEGIEAIKRVEKNESISLDAFRNYFITSFSGAVDNLNMWGMYAAKGSGIALGFDLDIIKNYFGNYMRCSYGQEEIDQNLKSFLYLCRQKQSVFFPTNGKSQIIEIPEEETAIRVQNELITTCLSAKNEAYRMEKEVRCYRYVSDKRTISYKEKNGIITPFITIGIIKDALKEIVIGPTNQQELSHKSIEYFLESNEYYNVKIKKSIVPYRG